MAAQVMKLREEGDLGETGRICAESSLLASMFLGRCVFFGFSEDEADE